MKPITIKQLHEQLTKLVSQGKGDYLIFLTDDEECNGYHACWFLGNTPKAWDKKTRKYTESINCDLSTLGNDKDKAFYLG